MQLKNQERQVAEFIDRHNPLYLAHEGVLQYYENPVALYVSWLTYLRTHFTRGYIEVIYYVCTYYDLPVSAVRQLLRNPMLKSKENWVLFVNWNTLDPLSTLALRALAQRLHRIFGTTYRENDLNEAIKIFNETFTSL